MKKLDLSMLPINLKVGEEMEVLTPKGDKVTVRCVEDKRENMCECCTSCYAPWDVCIQMNCTAGNFYFRPFETYKEGEEYNVGDLLKIPKFGEHGKFILSMVVEDDIDDEFNNSICQRCTFNNWIYPTDCCYSRNKCVNCLRDTNGDNIYYKPLAEVSE